MERYPKPKIYINSNHSACILWQPFVYMENEKAIDNDQAQSTVDTFIQKKKCKKVSVQKKK